MVPTWANTLIQIFEAHNIEIRHLNMIGRGDIEYIAMILKTYKLYFWSMVFYEYSYYLDLIDQDSSDLSSKNKKIYSDNGWRNHRFIGSLKDDRIVNRNKKIENKSNLTIQEIFRINNSKSLSIMNPLTAHLFKAGRFCLGNILSPDMELIKVSNTFNYLTSSQHNQKELNDLLLMQISIFKKLS